MFVYFMTGPTRGPNQLDTSKFYVGLACGHFYSYLKDVLTGKKKEDHSSIIKLLFYYKLNMTMQQ